MRIYSVEGGCLSGRFVQHSNSVKPQLKWGVPEIREVGVSEKSVVSEGFLCVCSSLCHIYVHMCLLVLSALRLRNSLSFRTVRIFL